jgi:hypothetical protein
MRAVAAAGSDLTRYMGGAVVLCHEDGSQTSLEPLAAEVGSVITLRAEYRCATCQKPVGRIEDYEAGTHKRRVFVFVGQVVARDDQRPETVVAFLDPPSTVEVTTECVRCGPLEIDRATAELHVQISLRAEAGSRRATLQEKLHPRDAAGRDTTSVVP